MRSEQEIKTDLADCEMLLAKLAERMRRLQGHADSLRAELLDLVGAHDTRPVGVR